MARGSFPGTYARASRVWLGALAVGALLGSSTSANATAGTTVDFPFDDRARLVEPQSAGGRVYVPEEITSEQAVPLVVFLHGANREQRLHRWMRNGPLDLRPIVEDLSRSGRIVPFLLAAPSQTRNAESGRHLWDGFDLDAFVRRTSDSLKGRGRVDESRVFVIGHSAAGCNPSGGLLSLATKRGAVVPAALVAIDTCMDAESAGFLGRADASTALWIYWQPYSWPREFGKFLEIVAEARPPSTRHEREMRAARLLGVNPHFGIVHPAFVDAVEHLLPPPRHDARGDG